MVGHLPEELQYLKHLRMVELATMTGNVLVYYKRLSSHFQIAPHIPTQMSNPNINP